MTLLLPSSPSRPRPPVGRFQSFTLQPYQRGDVDAAVLTAAAGGSGGEWESHICFEGLETGDGREIAPGALKMRPGPTLPLMGLDQRTMGHFMSKVCGSMRDAERLDDGTIYGGGRWAGTELGQYFEELATPDENGFAHLHWVSVDLEVNRYEYVVKGYDEDGYEEYLMRITDANLMGVTMVPFPAFSRAFIAPKGGTLATMAESAVGGAYDLPGASLHREGPIVIAASAAQRSDEHPPAEWFPDASKGESPGFTGLTHVRVEEPVNGWRRFAGHLADWSQPHVSVGDGTVYAPKSRSGYRFFQTKPFKVMGADGPETIKVGVVTVGGGHADTRMGWRLAAEHYDNPNHQGAVVVAGEDAFGPWIAGAVRADAPETLVRVLSHSDVSGDWRRIGGDMELVGIAAVNTAGFPVLESIAASAGNVVHVDFAAAFESTPDCPDGEMISLVAAGMIRLDPTEQTLAQVKRRLGALEAALEPFRGLGMEWLAQQMSTPVLTEAQVRSTLAARA